MWLNQLSNRSVCICYLYILCRRVIKHNISPNLKWRISDIVYFHILKISNCFWNFCPDALKRKVLQCYHVALSLCPRCGGQYSLRRRSLKDNGYKCTHARLRIHARARAHSHTGTLARLHTLISIGFCSREGYLRYNIYLYIMYII